MNKEWFDNAKKMLATGNPWFNAPAFMKVVTRIAEVARNKPAQWLKCSNAKYVEIRVDMRTGAFIVKDQDGAILSGEDLETLLGE